MSEPKIRVAVLFGGRSGEHEVSCKSAASILAGLDRDRYDVLPVRIGRDGVWTSHGLPTCRPSRGPAGSALPVVRAHARGQHPRDRGRADGV